MWPERTRAWVARWQALHGPLPGTGSSAIVEAPGGNVFIKMTGPAKTIAANQQKFELLLASFERAR